MIKYIIIFIRETLTDYALHFALRIYPRRDWVWSNIALAVKHFHQYRLYQLEEELRIKRQEYQ